MGDDALGFKRTLHHFPGTKVTPELVLHRTLEKVPRIKGVVVAIIWDDGSINADWSSMKSSELLMAARVMSIKADRELMAGETNEEVT